MNKTRYKIATLTGSAVMAAMLLSLLILNIVFNKKIELRAENAIKNVFTLDSDEYLNYESENDTGSLYYAWYIVIDSSKIVIYRYTFSFLSTFSSVVDYGVVHLYDINM